jgi:hypothetical protein
VLFIESTRGAPRIPTHLVHDEPAETQRAARSVKS